MLTFFVENILQKFYKKVFYSLFDTQSSILQAKRDNSWHLDFLNSIYINVDNYTRSNLFPNHGKFYRNLAYYFKAKLKKVVDVPEIWNQHGRWKGSIGTYGYWWRYRTGFLTLDVQSQPYGFFYTIYISQEILIGQF